MLILTLDMAKIYHGCMTKYDDGTNKHIGPSEKYLIPTDKCFWKGSGGY